MIRRRLFSTFSPLCHENPLGLPMKGSIPRMQRGLPQKRPIPGVNKVVAVSSAKGGVGKSTTSVNLATGLADRGLRVGLLDVDIFGPSIPLMMNLKGEPELTKDGLLVPLSNYGVKCMSMGFLVPEENAVVWRGLMVMKAMQQLLFDVSWGRLDVLVLDMPPGTGDTQLSVTQLIELAGAIIVSTPQDVALADVRRGVAMFGKVNVPILGLVENMSYHSCTNCGHKSFIFGHGGVNKTAESLNIELLASVPLHVDVCETSDTGRPIIISQPQSTHASVYKELSERVARKLNKDW